MAEGFQFKDILYNIFAQKYLVMMRENIYILSDHVYQIQLLSRPLPENMKLLTFEPRTGYDGEYILRLEHIYNAEEHPVLSSPTEVSLKVNCYIYLFFN